MRTGMCQELLVLYAFSLVRIKDELSTMGFILFSLFQPLGEGLALAACHNHSWLQGHQPWFIPIFFDFQYHSVDF